MKFANATNFNRKSGVAQWRDLQFWKLSLMILHEQQGSSCSWTASRCSRDKAGSGQA
jgi:hypothetical protein